MKIAIVVHGRFHAFDLALALIRRGHDVTVFTNYPKWAARKFGLPSSHVRSFWIHGILSRLARPVIDLTGSRVLTAFVHRLFGRWVAKQIRAADWDVIHAFSSVAEETFTLPLPRDTLKQLVRGSSHIRVQDSILKEETIRVGRRIERPHPWTISREEREYALADRIIVLSSFALNSFLQQEIAPDKLRLLPLGVDARRFRPTAEVVEERCRRICSGRPLRVLMVGTLSFRKGLLDLAAIVRALHAEGIAFRFVGDVPRESGALLRSLDGMLEAIGRQPHMKLHQWYSQSDLFLFPTIEDGYAAVLAQAYASALPILTTSNCSGPDLIVEGETGWVMPIRDPEAFIARLRWCNNHRDELAKMVRRIYEQFRPRDWDDVARDFEMLVLQPQPIGLDSRPASSR
jgi:glycosyltransferase involved in cell wall biosynthesis